MQGGIYNAALFDASQRQARQKLDQMAGIKRPAGILASSAELMKAATPAQPAPAPMAAPMAAPSMMPYTPPAAPMAAPAMMPPMAAPAMMPAMAPAAPGMMPTTQPALPQIPMQTAMAPMAPAPRTSAPVGQPQQPQPAGYQDGGEVFSQLSEYSEMGERLGKKAQKEGGMMVDIQEEMGSGATPEFVDYLRGAGDWMVAAVKGTHGSVEEAEKALKPKAQKLSAARDTGDQEQVVEAALEAVDLPNTEEGKKEFAQNFFGLEDVNDIDEINRRIANVAVASTIGKGPDAFAQAVLLGLKNYKETAVARASAKAGGKGGGMSPLEPFPDAVRDLAGKIMTATGEDPAVAIQQARDALAPYYTGQAGPTVPAPAAQPQNLRPQVEEALRLEPGRREEILKQATEMGVDIKGL